MLNQLAFSFIINSYYTIIKYKIVVKKDKRIQGNFASLSSGQIIETNWFLRRPDNMFLFRCFQASKNFTQLAGQNGTRLVARFDWDQRFVTEPPNLVPRVSSRVETCRVENRKAPWVRGCRTSLISTSAFYTVKLCNSYTVGLQLIYNPCTL